MSQPTSIAWTDYSWNPVRGCSRVSPGCQNCYAERVAARFAHGRRAATEDGPGDPPGPFWSFAENTPHGPRWTGKVALVEDHLLDPLRWRKPRRIFVNSMSDLFHESLPDEAIDRVFAVMAMAPRHTFQVLTKRAGRMRAYLTAWGVAPRLRALAYQMAREECVLGVMVARDSVVLNAIAGSLWPLPNVWLGVSCEDQQRADERIPLLLQTPAAVRFVSAEPLLGPIELPPASPCEYHRHDLDRCGRLDWVIVGGESGPGARPCELAWIRSIVQQCKAAGVACFVKQLGARPVSLCGSCTKGFRGMCRLHGASVRHDGFDGHGHDGLLPFYLKDRKGGDPEEWPEDLRVREFPR